MSTNIEATPEMNETLGRNLRYLIEHGALDMLEPWYYNERHCTLDEAASEAVTTHKAFARS